MTVFVIVKIILAAQNKRKWKTENPKDSEAGEL